MKKKILLISGVLAGLILIGLFIGYLMLNSIVKIAVENGATNSLKVRTQLARASVAAFGGDVSLTDLRVASPEGFSAPEIFTLGNVAVNVSYSELFGDPVKVASITINKPKLVIEQAGGKFNFMELAKNLKSDKPAPAPAPKDGKPLKVLINQIELSGAVVEIRPGIPGLDQPILIDIPAVSLSNIGNTDGSQNGEEIGRIVTDVIEAMAQKAAESDKLPPQVRELLKLDVENLKAELTNRAEKEVEKYKDKAINEIGKGLDNLLGDKKKDDKPKK